ncbi:hypothetical protein JCM24511_01347 [Saitozyma sp. JCM 24511]|nr:hypothetical protein JCM24511_01347 [Saitozyma sp. JCM 24511]
MAYGNKTYAVIQRDQVCYWSSWKGAMNQAEEVYVQLVREQEGLYKVFDSLQDAVAWGKRQRQLYLTRQGESPGTPTFSEQSSCTHASPGSSPLPPPPGSLLKPPKRPRHTNRTGPPGAGYHQATAHTSEVEGGRSAPTIPSSTLLRSSPTGGADAIQGAHLRDAAYRAALIRYPAGSPIIRKVLSDLSLLGDLEIRSITSLSELEEGYTRAQRLQRKERESHAKYTQDQERRKRKLEKDKDKDKDRDPICALLSPLSDKEGPHWSKKPPPQSRWKADWCDTWSEEIETE